MIDQKKFLDHLQTTGVEFITGVPDTLLNDFCLNVEAQWPRDRHVIAANEGNAIALAAGYHLVTGSVPLVYMQNSGLGNAINPLISLTSKEVYSIPMVLLIGWRGAPDNKDWAQHKKQGELTPVLLDSLDIPYQVIDNDGVDAFNSTRWAVLNAQKLNGPVALLANKGVFEKGKKIETDNQDNRYKMSRENAIECVLKCVPEDTIFVATTGRASRELYELRNLSGTGHDMDFLNVGAMGHASSISTG
ncbi:thiamine pyrophosphate-binding protein, partial [Bacteroidota bacterium]